MRPAGFETILCPVDFSELSGHALRYAARLAVCGGAKLVAIYANWFDAPAYFTEGRIAELTKEFRDSQGEAEQSLAAFVKSTLGEQAGAVEIRVAEGLPADVILAVAASTGAGLIVMGTHGRTGYNRWMMGSVAEHVLRESTVRNGRGPGAPDSSGKCRIRRRVAPREVPTFPGAWARGAPAALARAAGAAIDAAASAARSRERPINPAIVFSAPRSARGPRPRRRRGRRSRCLPLHERAIGRAACWARRA